MVSLGKRRAPWLLGVAAILISARPIQAETLADALALAYESNPTLQGQRYQLRAVDEAYVQAQAGWRPTLQAQMTGTYDREKVGRDIQQSRRAAGRPAPDFTEQNAGVAQLSLDQPIYTGGRTAAEVSAAEAQVRAAREALRGAEADTMLSVIQAYADVRRDLQSLEIRRTNLAALLSQLAATRARARAGEVTRTDTAQAEAQLEAERALISSAQGQLQASRAEYAAVVGQDPGELEAEPPLPGVPASVELAFDLAEDASPELTQAKFIEQECALGSQRHGRPIDPTCPCAPSSGSRDLCNPTIAATTTGRSLAKWC